MAGAGVQGGLAALELLSNLLFGRRHPSQYASKCIHLPVAASTGFSCPWPWGKTEWHYMHARVCSLNQWLAQSLIGQNFLMAGALCRGDLCMRLLCAH